MRTTTKLVLATLALGRSVGLAAPSAAAVAAPVSPGPVSMMGDCVYIDPWAQPTPYWEVNADECILASF